MMTLTVVIAMSELELPVVSYVDLSQESVNPQTLAELSRALYEVGIVGIRDIEGFKASVDACMNAWIGFNALPDSVKAAYTPDRTIGENEGYEAGKEQFQDQDGNWQLDNLKTSFYGRYEDHPENVWPKEIDLATPVRQLAGKMMCAARIVHALLGLDMEGTIPTETLTGYIRLLRYVRRGVTQSPNPNWCSPHCDHGVLTTLVPARYYREGARVAAPQTGGLYIRPHNEDAPRRVVISGDSDNVLLIQAADYGQLVSNDQIVATEHYVAKSFDTDADRYTMAVFLSPNDEAKSRPHASVLMKDTRYERSVDADGFVSFPNWHRVTVSTHYADTL